jgi:hypothetical protein
LFKDAKLDEADSMYGTMDSLDNLTGTPCSSNAALR